MKYAPPLNNLAEIIGMTRVTPEAGNQHLAPVRRVGHETIKLIITGMA
jgi:hypothetical protein